MQRSGLTELEVVLAVARQQSFRAAARELGLSFRLYLDQVLWRD